MRVLLIDDETRVTDAIKDRFEDVRPSKRRGFNIEIDVANNMYQAHQYLSSSKTYDLIISDLLLPNRGADLPSTYQGQALTGWFFIHHHILNTEGRYYEKCKETAIILFSAYGDIWNNYIKDTNQNNYSERVSLVAKGHIYNNAGGYASLIKNINQRLNKEV